MLTVIWCPQYLFSSSGTLGQFRLYSRKEQRAESEDWGLELPQAPHGSMRNEMGKWRKPQSHSPLLIPSIGLVGKCENYADLIVLIFLARARLRHNSSGCCITSLGAIAAEKI